MNYVSPKYRIARALVVLLLVAVFVAASAVDRLRTERTAAVDWIGPKVYQERPDVVRGQCPWHSTVTPSAQVIQIRLVGPDRAAGATLCLFRDEEACDEGSKPVGLRC